MFLVFWFNGGGTRSVKVEDKREARKIMEACEGETELVLDEPPTLIMLDNVNYISIETMDERYVEPEDRPSKGFIEGLLTGRR